MSTSDGPRKRKMSLLEKEGVDSMGGEDLVKAILRGERPEGFEFDPEFAEIAKKYANVMPRSQKAPLIKCPDPIVPPRRQMWNNKEFCPRTMQTVEREKVNYHLSRLNAVDEEEYDQSDYEYSISDFMALDEGDRINSKDFKRDRARYARDKKLSDGFDVGHYPYIGAARICSGNFLFRHYKPPDVILPKRDLHTLTCLSQLAISVYNMHQVPTTQYHNVQVLKAIKFGPCGDNLNLTFQASFPPITFQARLDNCSYPQDSPYYSLEIVLVRKADVYDQTDYVGVEWLPKFPPCMEHLSDFDEKDPRQYSLVDTQNACNLPLYLSQFALHQYCMDEDEEYDNVKVLTTLKSLNDDQGTTYFITFEAFKHDDDTHNPQIFEAKLFMSPLLPTTKIKIRFVRIKPN